MSDASHGRQTVNKGIHTPFAWTFADSAARLAFTVTTGIPAISGQLVSPDDLDRVALDLDTGLVFRLIGIGPEVWQALGITNDPDAIHDNVAAEISAITLKATPIAADFLIIEDSAAADVKKRITIGTLPVASHTHLEADITDLDHTDTDAIHDNVAAEISAITLKATPIGADLILIEDSAAANAKKRVTASSLVAVSHTHLEADITDLDHDDTDAIHDNVAAEISAITLKATVVGADIFIIEDSAAANVKKRVTASAIVAVSHTHTESDITDLDHDDTDAIHDNVAAEISAVTLKAAPIAADFLLIEDSVAANAKKRITIGTLPVASHTHLEADITDLDHTDTDAIHDNVASEISAITSKATVVGADLFIIEDSAAANVKKRVTASAIVAVSHTHLEADITDLDHDDTDAIHDNVAAEISAVTLKATPIAADFLLIEDSAAANAKKRITIGTLPVASHTHLEADITDLDHTDTDAIHDNVASEISAITSKATVVGADLFIIEDSAAANVKKSVTASAIVAVSHTHTESDITDLDHDDTDAIHDNVAAEISAVTLKATPIAADFLLIEDSAAADVKKRITIGTLPVASHTHLEADITDLDHTDTDAIHDNVASEISGITEKVTPVDADLLVIEDSAAANAKKRIQIGNLPGAGSLPVYLFPAEKLSNPLTADWSINALAPLAEDTNNTGLLVRLFDDTTEEGIGFTITVPSGAASMQIFTLARAESGPAGAVVAKLLLYEREISDNAAVAAWSSSIALTDVDLPITTEFFQEDSTDKTLASWGLTAGKTHQIQITRTSVSDTLVGDLALNILRIEFT